MISAMICFGLAAIQVPFVVQDPTRWWNWASILFCALTGLVIAMRSDN
jgi:hypothetical protein